MTGLIYQDQSAEALRLNLVQGAVDKDLLTVLCTGKVDLPYGKVEAGIIGASHYFEFTSPDGSILFTEVFACTDLDVKKRVFYGGLNDASSIRKHFKNITYDFKVSKMNWRKAESKFETLSDTVQSSLDQYQIGLQFAFPCSDDGNFPPVTLVYLKADPEVLFTEVHTLHAYPNEDSLVFTTTTIQQI